jgi:hypothetical protein
MRLGGTQNTSVRDREEYVVGIEPLAASPVAHFTDSYPEQN